MPDGVFLTVLTLSEQPQAANCMILAVVHAASAGNSLAVLQCHGQIPFRSMCIKYL